MNRTFNQLMRVVDDILEHIKLISGKFKEYVVGMDGWVKDINKRINDLKFVDDIVSENADNIQHNYEMIYELKDQIADLKQEFEALKLIQIISLKKRRIEKQKKIQ